MRRLIIGSICLVSAACGGREVTTPVEASASSAAAAASAGFDRFGYNDAAMMFNGVADGVDRNLDGKLWGSPSAYAGDHLVMKWNAEWERGNREGWSKPPYRAWLNNQWSGRAGGSGSVWHYKYKWVGRCGADYTPLPSGGYCIWGSFEVLQDHGIDPSFDSGHMWFARSVPGGYGR